MTLSLKIVKTCFNVTGWRASNQIPVVATKARYFSTGTKKPTSLTKTDLAKTIAEEHELTQAKANRILTTMLDTVVEVCRAMKFVLLILA